MSYPWLFFDLDGTLTDSGEGITNSVAYALRKMDRPVPPMETLRLFIGPPLLDSFQKFCGMTEAEAREAVTCYREYFTVTGIWENRTYEGVPALLETLRSAGKKLVLATSKPEPFALQILERFDLAKYFTFVAGATLSETRTRKDEVIAYALQELSLSPAEVLMVGDRADDVKGAAANGMDAVGVLYGGYGSRDELLSAVALAESPKDLEKLLLSL